MLGPKYGLGKSDRLKSQKTIKRLFDEGQSLFKFPFKLYFLIENLNPEDESPLKFSISVPKKKFRSAVKRNLIKRRVRESYRINKHDLKSQLVTLNKHKISLMFVYISDEIEKYDIIEKSIITLIDKLSNEIPS